MKGKQCGDSIKAEIKNLIQNGWDMVNLDNKQSQKLADKVFGLAKKNGCDLMIAQAMLLQARIHINNGEYAKAAETAMEARTNIIQLNDLDGKIKADHVMGYLCSSQGDLETALSYYQDGLKLMKENNIEVDPVFLNNIAVIYAETGKMDETLTLCLEALEIAEKNDLRLQGLILSNIAEVYLQRGEANIALEYIERGLAVLQKSKVQDHYLASCFNTFALIYAANEQWDKALDSCRQSLQIYQNMGQKYNEAVQFIEIGRLFLMQEKHQDAIFNLEEAANIGSETASEGIRKDAYSLLSQCYEKLGNYQKAYEYLSCFNVLNEKIKTRELNERLSAQMVELKIEKAQKDAEIERLKNIELKRQAEENELKAQILAESYKDIKIIGEIGQKLTATLDFKRVNNLIYKHIHKLMDVDVFGICLYHEEQGQLDFKMFIKNEKRIPLNHIAVDNEQSLAAECIRTKKVILLNDVSEEGRILAQKDGKTILHPKSIIYHPLLIEDRVIGAITVQNEKADAYNEHTLEMLKALASYIAIALHNSHQSGELKKKSKELEILSKTDALTELYNRRHIMERMIEEAYRYDRNDRLFCVVILDIDSFKSINDVYGHNCGDYVLVEISKILRSFMRRQDVCARWGGEEFLIMIPDTDLEGAVSLCERIRHKINTRKFSFNKETVKVSVTFGVAQYDKGLGIDAVINNADKALYRGKSHGRDCVVCWGTVND